MEPELRMLMARMPLRPAADPEVLREAGAALRISWPGDYQAMMAGCDGGEGRIGEWWVQLWPAAELVLWNREAEAETTYPGLVLFGSDGRDEALAFERESGSVVLVPFIGAREDWIRLGGSLTEAFRRFERDDVFGA